MAADLVRGDLLEVGCGEGRGIDWLLPKVTSYSAIDKIAPVIEILKTKYPVGKFYAEIFRHFPLFEDNSFDS
ncbi:MAG: methyltransferase domain-containing protein, partial [Rhizobium sp.]|nr:methyltransferase domain-containing protein [Rhizobium sp.]